MPDWLNLEWGDIFIPSKPIAETVLRGSLMYLALFILLRLFRRQTGSLGPADLLVLLLIADASQNAMAHGQHAVTDGLILVATIIGWEYAIDWACYRIPAIGQLVERSPLPLIEHGKINHRNLKRELMSEEEFLSQLRQKGVGEPSRVRQSFLEGDGGTTLRGRIPLASAPGVLPLQPTA